MTFYIFKNKITFQPLIFFTAFLLFQTSINAQIFNESNLPIIIINTDNAQEIPDEPDVFADMKVIYKGEGVQNFVIDQNNPLFLNYNGRIAIQVRGSSSQSLPKKQYSFSTKLADNVSSNNVVLENFKKLNEILSLFETETIVFLGDLFHSHINIEWDFFENWVQTISKEVILIQGNHDIIEKKKYLDLGIKIHKELVIDDFIFSHYPLENPELFNFCGHIHPSIKLKGIGKQYLKLPCFFQKPNQMILPAFGEFTGTFSLIPTENDKIFAITNEKVIEIKV